jgi:predicted transcriptional regulator
MRLHELMDSRVGTVSANDYAAEALHLMNLRSLSWCFVLDRNEVTGLVWARDLAQLPDALLMERDVREFVTTQLLTVNIDTEVQEVERLLHRTGQRLLGVVKNNLPVGILNRDALRYEDPRPSALAQPSNRRLAS